MPFFIAIATLVLISGAYLLHQFLARELEQDASLDDAPAPDSAPAEWPTAA